MGTRLIRHVALAAAVVMVAGCGNDDDTVAPTTTTSAPTTTVTELDLPAALLTPDDLGEGWSINAAGPEGEPVDGAVTEEQQRDLPRPEVCDEASAEARQAIEGLTWQAFRSMELAVDDPIQPPLDRSGHLVFLQELLALGPPDAQRATFELMRQGFQACLGDIAAGEEGPGRADNLAVPPIGDDRFGVLITIEEAGAWAEWRLHQVIVLDGPVIMSLIIGDIRSVDVEPWFTDDALGAVATTAAEKLRSRTSP